MLFLTPFKRLAIATDRNLIVKKGTKLINYSEFDNKIIRGLVFISSLSSPSFEADYFLCREREDPDLNQSLGFFDKTHSPSGAM